MAASSVASPLCTWLVAACMSVTCDRDCSPRASMLSSSRRRPKCAGRGRLPSKCSSFSGEFQKGLISAFSGSSIQGLMSSCLAFEPCDEYYCSKGLSSLGCSGLSSLFGSKSGASNRRQRCFNGAAYSGNCVFLIVFDMFKVK
ncbi:hypothetical protein C1H46_020702 [Malus baccata]|uniref:Secreted protein n=1 Tax=Malus baccata TaxID=106549 RepID=A0A540M4R9_MALBA|nr:hypothetical protein C1H46_020702 [Malus baccata]